MVLDHTSSPMPVIYWLFGFCLPAAILVFNAFLCIARGPKACKYFCKFPGTDFPASVPGNSSHNGNTGEWWRVGGWGRWDIFFASHVAYMATVTVASAMAVVVSTVWGCRWGRDSSTLRQLGHMWTYRHLHATVTPSYCCLSPFFILSFSLSSCLSVLWSFQCPFISLLHIPVCLISLTRGFSISQLDFDTFSIYKISRLRNRIGIWVC